MTVEPEMSIDQTIAAAVHARIEAEVTRALAGDEIIGRYVVAAMQQIVEVPNGRDHYQKVKVPFITHVLTSSIQKATKEAVNRLIAEEQEAIDALVVKALRKRLPDIASAMAGALAGKARESYGLSIDLDLKIRGLDS